MQLRQIGKTAIGVTEIGFGCSAIGNRYRKVTDAEADSALAAAWEADIRYFDMAPFYGRGLAVERLGDFLRARPRAEWVVSTKVGRCCHRRRRWRRRTASSNRRRTMRVMTIPRAGSSNASNIVVRASRRIGSTSSTSTTSEPATTPWTIRPICGTFSDQVSSNWQA